MTRLRPAGAAETWFTCKAETVFDPALTGPQQWETEISPAAKLVRATELRARGSGLYQLDLRHFGGWLRLRCDLRGDAPRVKLTIYLALKE